MTWSGLGSVLEVELPKAQLADRAAAGAQGPGGDSDGYAIEDIVVEDPPSGRSDCRRCLQAEKRGERDGRGMSGSMPDRERMLAAANAPNRLASDS